MDDDLLSDLGGIEFLVSSFGVDIFAIAASDVRTLDGSP